MKCKRDTDGRAHSHAELQTMRQLAVKAVRDGKPVKEVAETFRLNIRTVFRWLAEFAAGGQQALLAKPIPGRPKLLTADQMRWVAETVRDKTPLQCRFEFALWTLSMIGELIQREFGITLTPGSVRNVMKTLGFTPQRPLYRAHQRDDVLVERWRTEEYPKIKAQARAAGATIYFADEAGMRSDYHAGTTWAPAGRTPTVSATGRRYSINMISAIGPRGEFRFMLHDGGVDATVFREFLERLLHKASRPVFLIVDGHPIHRSKVVKEFVEANADRLRLFILPPYSPHVNPDEQVWGVVKAEVAKKTPATKDALKYFLLSALHRLQKLPDKVRGFFNHPDCRYAAADK